MQMQGLSQLHRSNIAVALPYSRPFSQKTSRFATSTNISRSPGALIRPQHISSSSIAKRVEAEIVPEEESTSQVEFSHTEDAQSSQTSTPWKLFRQLCKVVTVGALCLAMAFASVNPALAAGSGGRAGGSAFSSARSGGYSGGLSSGAGRGLGSSSSSSSMFGGGARGSALGSGVYQRSPSVSINSFGWYGAPMYGGYGYGAPVVSTGGGGFFNILILAAFAAIAYSVIRGSGSDGAPALGAGERVTVAKLQVGLLGSARQLQRDLDRIAGRADTNTPSGLHYVLQETVLSLLRHPDYCIYGQGTISNQRSLEAGESKFNALSMEERSKVKEETLVNVSGRSRRGAYSSGSQSSASNELIVVTLLVAAEGGLKLPKVTSLEELRSALNTLGGISESQTLAVEVSWTPQDPNDHYTRDDMMQDFPTLNSL